VGYFLSVVSFFSVAICVLFQSAAPAARESVASHAVAPTFYKDVLPILQQHCQTCHRPGEIAPIPFVTYEQTSAWADQIADAVHTKRMPPWFADPCCGHFANDSSLTAEEIKTLSAWANAKAPAGNPGDAPKPRYWAQGWNIPQPDLILKMPAPVAIPARGDVEYTYEIVPTGFAEDRWVQMSEVKPSGLLHVHHAVIYIRPPESKWLRRAPVGVPFTASSLGDAHLQHQAHSTDSDMLLVYAPGSSPDQWPNGMAKFIPAHSDLIFQMHYTTNGHAAKDQSSIGIVFAKEPPKQRVLTLQLANDHDAIPIPPGADNYRVEVHGTLPNDATLVSFFPHMHLRGKRFEYDIVHHDESPIKEDSSREATAKHETIEPLLKVNYDFYWQLSYRFTEPRFLKAGTELRAVAWYDNSRKNPHNPDPDDPVQWGDQTYNEMMVGFFDVAVPAQMDKWQFFIRPGEEKRAEGEGR
jgi:hypothetical protein